MLSYVAGLIFFGGVMYWLTAVTKLGFFILIPVLALFFALFALAGNIFLRNLRCLKLDILLFLIIPSLWVVLEFVRGVLFTGFPWAILGYTQYKNPILIQVADITGAFGVSFVIMMVNFLLYCVLQAAAERFFGLSNKYFRNIRILKYGIMITALILVSVFVYGLRSLREADTDSGYRLSIVQGNIPQEKKWDPSHKSGILDRYETLTREAAKDGGDLIIWPETSVPGYMFEGDISRRITSLAKEIDIPLLLGLITFSWDEEGNVLYFNTASLMSAGGTIERAYYKIHLVPFGEFIPFEKNLPSIREWINVPMGDFSPGTEYTLFDLRGKGNGLKYAALICFEDIFPGLVRRFVYEGADILINMTNDAWFGESSEQLQHAQASVFRAVENRVSVIRAANTGFSCYIDPKGAIEDSITDSSAGMYTEGFRTFSIKIGEKNSFYTRYGDIFVYLCLFFVFGASLLIYKTRSG